MTLTEKLQQILSQADKATEGPWHPFVLQVVRLTGGGMGQQKICTLDESFRESRFEDAAFIASSRVLVPALARALGVAHTALSDIAGWCPTPDEPDKCKIAECHVSRKALAEIEKLLEVK